MVNTDRDWIYRKPYFQFEALITVTMTILKKLLEEDEEEDCLMYDNI
jgi:hypothetical protein